MQNMITHS
jgi:hypothetical protein